MLEPNPGLSSEPVRSGSAEVTTAREAVQATPSSGPRITNPQEHLRPFVEFLHRDGAEPKAFLLKALASHQVVIMGEIHHRPRYWAFNSSLVRDKAFAERVGVIYMELPSNDQALVEQFLAAPTEDTQPLVQVLRDMQICGWSDQAELEFFKAVWEVNQGVPKERRLRIVLADNPWPWKELTTPVDWQRFDIGRVEQNRNQLMTDNILRDLREHAADPRHALFIVGYLHAIRSQCLTDGKPYKSAGRRLGEQLGDTHVFAVFPHSPVMGDAGGTTGRIALGLFETAFAALTNRPMAFPLDHGPFGEQGFDATTDLSAMGAFRDCFQAYLFLGPCEDEIMSPLIPGFYNADFLREFDRRRRLSGEEGLMESGLKRLDEASFLEFGEEEEGACGQPRFEWSARRLGPLRAWEWGSHWKKDMVAAKMKTWPQETDAIRQAAVRLLEAIRQANYDHPGYYASFPAPEVEYEVKADRRAWVAWICQHFRTNPIVSVNLGEVKTHTNGLPALSYEIKLQNGRKLVGLLPMNYNPGSEDWYGAEGLDWHLQSSGAGTMR